MREVSRARRRRQTWVGLATLIIALGVAACSLMTGPLPADAELFDPPAIFARWWAMTEACSGRSGDLTAVRWYRAPGSAVSIEGESASGYWNSQGNQIVLAEEQVDNGLTVRHEMLHALLNGRGHPRAEFLDACASVVDCFGTCAADAVPWHPPQPDYVVLPPDSLDIHSGARLLPNEADGQRWVTLELTVGNPRGHAVMVASPGDPAASPRSFVYDVRGPEGGIASLGRESDSSTLFFRPYETKSRLFEFRVGPDLTPYRLPPGTYLMRGGYARRWATYDTVLVSP